jgi:polysaccharide pyruvyl transferase WcaK-like protein
MHIYLVNDTSAFHCGSAAVCGVIGREIAARGHTLDVENDKTAIDKHAIESCDAVVVNGEGTLHDSTPRALRILETLRFAQALRKHTVLCNASWFNMGNSYDDVLRKLDQCTVRDQFSKDQLVQSHGVHAEIAPDLSFYSSEMAVSGGTSRRVLTTDFYSREFRAFVRPVSGQLAKFDTIDMAAVSWQKMLDETAASEMLATGRHHGVYAACKTRTPFFACPGNTPKIEGLIAWSRIDVPFAKHPAELAGLLARAGQYRVVFTEFFDWLHSLPPWRFPY